jgi:3,4-dehydroadipyl-CoA semialdehyde dehydrogenase
MPILAKPASATALLAHAMVKDVIAAKVLPEGALSLLCGSAGNLLAALTSDDVIAFTGSADTAARVRGDPNVVRKCVPVNIEADSINAAVLAPGSSPGGAAHDAFLREVVREMTVKAGQKCTAIRRIFVPVGEADAIADALAAKLTATKVGDPRESGTRMGPLVTRAQQAAAFEGIRRLASEASIVCGGADAPRLDGIDGQKSAFVAPTLLRAKDSAGARTVHEVEVFGPAATIVPYRDEADACTLVARGGGSLVASIYGDDKDFLLRMVSEIGAGHGVSSPLILPLRPPTAATALSCRNAITAVLAVPGRARNWAGSMACASITSAWPCRARAISSPGYRPKRPAFTETSDRCAAQDRLSPIQGRREVWRTCRISTVSPKSL